MTKFLYRIKNRRLTKTLNKGYSWRGNVLKNTISKVWFGNHVFAGFLNNLEIIINKGIDDIKMIKRSRSTSLEKWDINHN
jgi:hypothetical protein